MNKRPQHALTLIELLAALALAGALLAACFTVLCRGAKVFSAPAAAQSAPRAREALRELLARDLRQARRYRPTSAGIVLETFHRLEGRTMTPRFLPAEVSYELAEVGRSRRKVLLRRQQSPDEQAWAEIVSFSVIGIGMAGEQGPAEASGRRWLPMPSGGAFTVAMVDGEAIEIDLGSLR